MPLPEQMRPGVDEDPLPRRGKKGRKGPATRTQQWFGAAFAYLDYGEAYEAHMGPGELARRIAKFAVEHGLDGANELYDAAATDDHTSRDLMESGLKGIRHIRGR
jgi:hypothetical protein